MTQNLCGRATALIFYLLLAASTALSGRCALAQSPAPAPATPTAGVVASVVMTTKGVSQLQQSVFDATGQNRVVSLALPKRHALLTTATSGGRHLHLLRNTGADSVLLVLTDSLGQEIKRQRQHLPRLGGVGKGFLEPYLYGLPQGQGFIFTHASGRPSHLLLHFYCFGTQLQPRWDHIFEPGKFTPSYRLVASTTHLWAVLEEGLTYTQHPHLWSCELATGKVEGHFTLETQSEIEAVEVVPAGLLILGNAHRRHTPPMVPGQPLPQGFRNDFVVVLSPKGERLLEVTLGWPSPRPDHRWQTARALPGGGYEIIGETFRQPPSGEAIAMALVGTVMVGMGGFGVFPTNYTNMRPDGLLLARVGPTGIMDNLRQVEVPEAMRLPGAENTKALPSGYSSSFRLRGFVPGQPTLVLNTSHQVLLYSLTDGKLTPLTSPRPDTPTVLAIWPSRLALAWVQKNHHSNVSFEQVALP